MTNKLEIFPWDDNFSTGIPEVDAQHKQLVKLLNHLVSHLTYNPDVVELNLIFNELKEYAALHFRNEEAIWERGFAEDTWVLEHKKTHEMFVHEVTRLQDESLTKPFEEAVVNIAGFLTHWLALHILESDKRFSHAINGVQQGKSLDEAKRYADDRMSGATRMMIDTILTMYDKLANRAVQFSREINKRKRVELKLKQALDDLRHFKDIAAAATQAKGNYLADVSCAIRLPLQDLVELVQEMRNDEHKPITPCCLERLDAAIDKLERVAENAQRFSEPDHIGTETAPSFFGSSGFSVGS